MKKVSRELIEADLSGNFAIFTIYRDSYHDSILMPLQSVV
jgi:hypothetical protein